MWRLESGDFQANQYNVLSGPLKLIYELTLNKQEKTNFSMKIHKGKDRKNLHT
jgi:hypothetical protein